MREPSRRRLHHTLPGPQKAPNDQRVARGLAPRFPFTLTTPFDVTPTSGSSNDIGPENAFAQLLRRANLTPETTEAGATG